jgi:hypothetical protein
MTLDKINQWLSLIANFGVIAGIVFLGLEVQQNSNAIQAQTYQSRTEATQEMMIAIMDSERVAPLFAEIDTDLFPSDLQKIENLDPESRLRVMAFYYWTRLQIDNLLYQHERGFLDDEYRDEVIARAISGFAPIWKELDVLATARPEFRAAIEEYSKAEEKP